MASQAGVAVAVLQLGEAQSREHRLVRGCVQYLHWPLILNLMLGVFTSSIYFSCPFFFEHCFWLCEVCPLMVECVNVTRTRCCGGFVLPGDRECGLDA